MTAIALYAPFDLKTDASLDVSADDGLTWRALSLSAGRRPTVQEVLHALNLVCAGEPGALAWNLAFDPLAEEPRARVVCGAANPSLVRLRFPPNGLGARLGFQRALGQTPPDYSLAGGRLLAETAPEGVAAAAHWADDDGGPRLARPTASRTLGGSAFLFANGAAARRRVAWEGLPESQAARLLALCAAVQAEAADGAGEQAAVLRLDDAWRPETPPEADGWRRLRAYRPAGDGLHPARTWPAPQPRRLSARLDLTEAEG